VYRARELEVAQLGEWVAGVSPSRHRACRPGAPPRPSARGLIRSSSVLRLNPGPSTQSGGNRPMCGESRSERDRTCDCAGLGSGGTGTGAFIANSPGSPGRTGPPGLPCVFEARGRCPGRGPWRGEARGAARGAARPGARPVALPGARPVALPEARPGARRGRTRPRGASSAQLELPIRSLTG